MGLLLVGLGPQLLGPRAVQLHHPQLKVFFQAPGLYQRGLLPEVVAVVLGGVDPGGDGGGQVPEDLPGEPVTGLLLLGIRRSGGAINLK